jgi:hypothetical protein
MKQSGMALTTRSEMPKAMSEFIRFSIASVIRKGMAHLTCMNIVRSQRRTRSRFSDDFASLPLRQGHSKDLTSFLLETL